MRPEDLRLTYMYVGIDYPTLPRFTGNEFPAFWQQIHGRHPFESCDKNEGVLETEAERRFIVTRDDMTLQEWVRIGFEPLKKNTVDLFKEATNHFGVRLFRVSDITFRALWPVPDELAPAHATLREKLLRLDDDHYKFLGAVESTPIEFVGDSEPPPRHWHVRLEGSLVDETLLFVELENTFFEPLQKADVVGEYLQLSYDFLTNNVTHFVNSFME